MPKFLDLPEAKRGAYLVPRIGRRRGLRSRILAPVKGAAVFPLTRFLRRRIISDYLSGEHDPKVQFGCGSHRIPGWLNTDFSSLNRHGVVHVDMRQRLPFPDGKIAFLFVEHALCELRLDEAIRFLAECHRVLRAGGVLRIDEDNLEFLASVYCGEHPMTERYIRRVVDTNHVIPCYSACIAANTWFLHWGTGFTYDPATLMWALKLAGFNQIERTRIGESSHPELRGIEGHGNVMPADLDEASAFALEAIKQDAGRSSEDGKI